MKVLENINDIIAVKKESIRLLNNTIEYYLGNGNNPKKAQLISKWIKEFSNYLRFEEVFDSNRIIVYRRGDIVKVNFGFNVGNELGGVHYAVVLDNDNKHSSGTLTVVPMGSYKPEKQLYSRDIYIGSEFYSTMLARVKKLYSDNQTDLADVLKMMKVAAASDDSDAEQLCDELCQRQKQLNESIKFCGRCISELEFMKNGSIIKLEQIRTISKMRIIDPRKTHDVLYGVALSNSTMDKISAGLSNLFLHNA